MPAMVVLDASGGVGSDALDMAVRAAASLCLGIAATGGCALLLPGAEQAELVRSDLTSWPALHARLALVSAGAAPEWRAAERSRVVIWVGARRPDAGLGAGRVAATVSPLARDDRLVMFEVCGCSVQAVSPLRSERAA
jgi:hypothetical protein